MISIIDYGMGNLASVKKALNKLGIPSLITNHKDEIINSTGIILPGVGSFKQAMENLHDLKLIPTLENEVIYKKKTFFRNLFGDAIDF